MKPLTLIASAAGLILISAPSFAQVAPSPPLPVTPPSRDLAAGMPSSTGSTNMADYSRGQAFRQTLTARGRAAVRNASPARMSRAERVAELINAGDCAGAYAMAREEGDRRLAHRVAGVCEIEE